MPDPAIRGVTLRSVETNGIRLRIAEAGSGPLVLLLHGFPESWYSWRRQLPALAAAGYRAAAPDMRGYGASDAPEPVEAYDIHQLVADATGVLDACGEERAAVVGHDWGAMIAWHCALLAPERFRAVAALSVPYTGRAPEPPTTLWRRRFGENFFYILYFQQPGVAEAEFDADPARILRRLYRSPDSEPAAPPEITDPRMSAGGFGGRMPEPKALPHWLSQADLDYYVAQFRSAGFRGGINYYRNFDRNWETTPQLAGAKVRQPAMFLAGSEDPVIGMTGSAETLEDRMREHVADLRRFVLVPGSGHWIQQERPDEVNRELIEFLGSLGE